MKVLINATSARLGGGVTVLKNLLPALLKVDGGRHTYVVVCRAEVVQTLDPRNSRVRMIARSARGGSLGRVWWEQAVLPTIAARENADIIFCLAGVTVAASVVPQVLMFQNAAPFDPDVVARSGSAKGRRFRVLRRIARFAARRARHVVFISDFAREITLPHLGGYSGKVSRLYLGRDLRFRPMTADEVAPTRRAFRLEHRYLLAVSQFYHYKNFVELVVGFGRAASGLPPEVQLILAGAEHEPDYAASVRRVIAREGLGDRVRLLGQVPYEELPALYAGATQFLFPSTCESFPNILVEALSSGVPTLASGRGPMRELAGDGAVYFDPYDPDAIAAAILRTWTDPLGAASLAQRGMEQARRYTWEATARGLLDAMEAAT